MNRLLMEKGGRGKFISHLDLMRTMQRAFIRAGLKIRHTQGFNPHPYMSFALPLSVGIESVCELLDFELEDQIGFDEIQAALNRCLPSGIRVLTAYRAERKFKEIKWLDIFCKLYYDCGVPVDARKYLIELFSEDSSLVVEKSGKRGAIQLDIRPLIYSINVNVSGDKDISLSARISAQDPALNPNLLISAIGKYYPQLSYDFCEIKRLEIYDKDLNIFR